VGGLAAKDVGLVGGLRHGCGTGKEVQLHLSLLSILIIISSKTHQSDKINLFLSVR
jgi:hypothetical protein